MLFITVWSTSFFFVFSTKDSFPHPQTGIHLNKDWNWRGNKDGIERKKCFTPPVFLCSFSSFVLYSLSPLVLPALSRPSQLVGFTCCCWRACNIVYFYTPRQPLLLSQPCEWRTWTFASPSSNENAATIDTAYLSVSLTKTKKAKQNLHWWMRRLWWHCGCREEVEVIN